MKKSPIKFLPGSLFLAVVAMAFGFFDTTLVAQSADGYIGSESCGECHPKEYAVWKNSHHAKATSVLPESRLLDKRCTQCHTTLAPGLDQDKVEGISNITCERCHGAGKYYAQTNVMKDKELRKLVGLRAPDEKMCTICHSDAAPSVRPFNFKEHFSRIAH